MKSKVIRLTEWTKDIHNIVEDDLRSELKQIIKENPNWGWEQISIQDVFGCAINQLPPIYIAKNSENTLRLGKDEIRNAIFKAMERIQNNPIYKSESNDNENEAFE